MERILVLAEFDQGQVKAPALAAISFAQRLTAAGTASFEILVLGEGIGPVAAALDSWGATGVHTLDHPALAQPLADRFAHALSLAARHLGATLVVAGASTFSKDILPRAAALLDAGMLSDVIEVRADSGSLTFKRVLFAGNAIATVQLEGSPRVITVRTAAFPAPARSETPSPIRPLEHPTLLESLPQRAAFVSRDAKLAGRPDATEARIVVSGGRALKNPADFERLVGGLADRLGAAIGSSRALVDAGITPNSLQIGQTGKVVAPDLYIALGISGAIQHMAGMKDAKVVVAINKDPDAPIFEVADYGWVADIYEAVPQLIQRLPPG